MVINCSSFSYHVNLDSEKLRNKFLNFDGKKELICKYKIDNPKSINKDIASDFSEQINLQMKEYLGKEVLDSLSPDFSTTDSNSTIIFKISIMNVFKKYFDYTMYGEASCGIPYIILEGTTQDYEKLISKTNFLKKYDFGWYTDTIIPHIEKMLEAKRGKIDIEFFKNIIQKKEVTERAIGVCGQEGPKHQVNKISGWFLHFFAYDSNGNRYLRDSVKVSELNDFASQVLDVPFSFYSEKEKVSYNLQYHVGFVGCEQNEKHEINPVTGWYITEKKKIIEKDIEKEPFDFLIENNEIFSKTDLFCSQYSFNASSILKPHFFKFINSRPHMYILGLVQYWQLHD